MKKSIVISAYVVATLLSVCAIAALSVPIVRHYQTVRHLKEQGIYEIFTLSPEPIRDEIHQRSYFMVCEPAENIEEQIEAFLAENNPLHYTDGIKRYWIFVRPSKAYPIGKFPQNEADFHDGRSCSQVKNVLAYYAYLNGECVYKSYPGSDSVVM